VLAPLTIKAQDQLAYNAVMVAFYNTQRTDAALTWQFDYYQQGLGALGFKLDN
jgi:hypothetical protein